MTGTPEGVGPVQRGEINARGSAYKFVQSGPLWRWPELLQR